MKIGPYFNFFILFLLLSCGDDSTTKDNAQLTFEIQRNESSSFDLSENFLSPFYEASTITSPSQFACVFLNVTGVNIPPKNPSDSGPLSQEYSNAVALNKPCTYEGVTSKAIQNQSGSSVQVSVPTGLKRLIQVLALSSGMTCPSTQSAGDIIRQIEASNGGHVTGFYELGRNITDVFDDKAVSIANQLNATNAYLKNMDVCDNGFKIYPTYVRYGYDTTFALNFSTGGSNSALLNWSTSSGYGLNGSSDPVSKISDNNNSTYISTGTIGGSNVGRIDALFPIGNIPLTFKVSLKYSFSCSINSPTIYSNTWNSSGTPAWNTPVPKAAVAGTLIVDTVDFGATPHNLTLADQSTVVDNAANGPFVYVSFRAPDTCGIFKIHESYLEYYQ